MIERLVELEKKRQKKVINLIPSENYASQNVLAVLGSELANKYAEGKSRQRYYFGCRMVDEIEDEVKRLVYKVFKISPAKYGVNVQLYSGSVANLACYLGTLNLGEKILAMSLEHGGHLSHGHKVSWTGRLFKFGYYGVNKNGFINYDNVLKIAKKFRPKLIICGATAYSRKIDFKKFKKIADSVGALLMADISHIAGLIAGGMHPTPFPHADIVMTTTHKTLRGPRGAIIIAKKDLMDKIDRAVFPGLQGGPHLHTIAAIGVALEEVLKPGFRQYARQIVKNAKILASELKKRGFKIVSGGTDNHLMLVDLTNRNITGKKAGETLEKEGIIVNKNMIPFDRRTPSDPSGIRLGTPAITTQGMKEKDMKRIAEKIDKILS